jgi:hypothetical protein
MSGKEWTYEYFPLAITAISPGYRKCSVVVHDDGSKELLIQNVAALALCKELRTDVLGNIHPEENPDELPASTIVPIIVSEGERFSLDNWLENECRNVRKICIIEPGEEPPSLDSPIVLSAIKEIESQNRKAKA